VVYSLDELIVVNFSALFISSGEAKHKLHEVGWFDRLDNTKDCVDEVFLSVVPVALSIVLLESLDHVAHHLRILALLVDLSHSREEMRVLEKDFISFSHLLSNLRYAKALNLVLISLASHGRTAEPMPSVAESFSLWLFISKE